MEQPYLRVDLTLAGNQWCSVCTHDATPPQSGLTWYGAGELVRFDGQHPPPQVVVPTVGGANQSDGTLAVGGLVVEGHLLIGQDVLVFCGEKMRFC